MSDDERNRLLQAAKEVNCSFLYPIIILALSTGMRKAEMMNLHWKHINFNNEKITLHETKNGEMRVVPLTGFAHTVMKEMMEKRPTGIDLVFPGTNPKVPIDIRYPWEQAIKKTNIEDFRFHDLRHSCASYLLMNGVPLPVIAEILGHKTYQMVKRYAHLSDDHKLKAIAGMNKNIFGC